MSIITDIEAALMELRDEKYASFQKKLTPELEEDRFIGVRTPALRKLAKELSVEDQVVIEGRLAHEQMFSWLDEMDLYIQPSMTEGMPRSLIEAMSRGLPALGSQTGGIPELLGPDCTFPRKDVDTIAKMISCSSPEGMEQKARNNFDRAKGFQKELLEQRRYDFYATFAKAAEAYL